MLLTLNIIQFMLQVPCRKSHRYVDGPHWGNERLRNVIKSCVFHKTRKLRKSGLGNTASVCIFPATLTVTALGSYKSNDAVFTSRRPSFHL